MNTDDIFIKLVHFFPQENSDISESVLIFLVQQIFLTRENITDEEIKTAIKNDFDLRFEKEEIKTAIDFLVSNSSLVKTKNKYFIVVEHKQKLNKLREDAKKEEISFAKSTKNKLIEIYPFLSDDKLDDLGKDFQLYLSNLFIKLGAEAVHVLYPSDDQREICNEVDIFSILPQRDREFSKFRKESFPALLKFLSANNKTYLSNKLKAVFFYNLISIDPQCSAYLQQKIRGHILYLDTNFLYCLFGLNEPELQASSEKLIDFATKFNFQFFVTPRTLEEFNTSLSNAEHFLRNFPVPTKNPELLKIGASVIEESIIRSYWEKYADDQMDLDEFINFYKNVKSLLQNKGVKISNYLNKVTKEDKEGIKKISEGVRQFGFHKNEAVVEHDAFHILLLNKIRELQKQKGSIELKHWFLTTDKSLIRYERTIERKKKGYYPYCILPEYLLQILRPLLPRSENYDKSLLDFVVENKNIGYESLPPVIAHKILKRLDRYKTKPKEVAIKILTDTHFGYKIKNIKNKESIDEEIDNVLLSKAEEITQEKETALKNNTEITRKNYWLRQENRELKEFKKEIEQKKKNKNIVWRWIFFSFMFVLVTIGTIFCTYNLINKLQLNGLNGVIVIVIAFLTWIILSFFLIKILPEKYSERLSEEIQSVLSFGKSLSKKKE